MVGSKSKKEGAHRGFSAGEWPVCGGLDNGTESCSYTELVITGHADGSVRFWDASATAMQSLYRIKTSKYFEKAKKAGFDGLEDDPYAISQIAFCSDCRMMAVAGASAQVIFFKFKKKETVTDTKCMEIPIVYEVSNLSQGVGGGNSSSPSGPHHFEFPPRCRCHIKLFLRPKCSKRI
jgi:syntaxin-binding protein 5